jgi:hypothetical protein
LHCNIHHAEQLFARPIVLTTTNTVIAELVQDWSTPQGSEPVQLLIATVPKTPRTD